MASLERRVITLAVEVRTEDDRPRLSGYAAVFNSETRIGDFFREQIAPGAFDEAITRDDVRALFNHNPDLVLGRRSSNTLTLSTDARGLRYDVEPPDTTWARDLMVSVRRGDVTQSSFGFTVDAEEWQKPTTRGELPLRIIRKVTLFDVSPVTYPAYSETSVEARTRVSEFNEASAAALLALQSEHARRRNRLIRAARESAW